MKVYTIYDNKAEIYFQPFCFATHGASLRAFKENVNDGKSTIWKHPADFTLFYVGNWDDNLGMLTTEKHVNLGCGIEMVETNDLPMPQALNVG